MEIVEEVLYMPKFSQEDYDRVKKQQLEGLKQQTKDPSSIASNVYRRLLYGDDHIYSVPSSGIEESVEKISLDDVKKARKSLPRAKLPTDSKTLESTPDESDQQAMAQQEPEWCCKTGHHVNQSREREQNGDQQAKEDMRFVKPVHIHNHRPRIEV